MVGLQVDAPGYWRRHVCKGKATATWEVLCRGRGNVQRLAGDSGRRRRRMAEGPVVLVKLGNARGGKGPWFKDGARSGKGQEIG
jgi:hypothetical protein